MINTIATVMDATALFYSHPSVGAGFPVFAGARRQRGGGIFGSLKNFFLPTVKKWGRQLFSHGIGLAKDVAQDALQGKNIKKALIDHGKSRAFDFGKTAAKQGLSALENMIGKGSSYRRRRRRVKRISRKRPSRKRQPHKRVSRKSTSRKRKAKSTSKPKAKRRRTASNF